MKSTPSPPPPAFVRVSDRDLTEIELHSVDSISDLHRTQFEQHKGVLPPRPPPPTTNGTLQMQDRIVVLQTGQPVRRPCMRLNDTCTSNMRYFLACAAVIVFLLILILIFIFLVQQSSALRTLLEMMNKRFNLTAVSNEQRP